jgi:hypothetical protein
LRDELLLIFYQLIEIAVERTLRDIAIYVHFWVSIALPYDTPATLLKVGGTDFADSQ